MRTSSAWPPSAFRGHPTSPPPGLSKGETFIDTAKNIEAIPTDVVRHPTPGAPHLLAQHVKTSVINAGDGATSTPRRGCSIS